jgi:hypothetical protein
MPAKRNGRTSSGQAATDGKGGAAVAKKKGAKGGKAAQARQQQEAAARRRGIRPAGGRGEAMATPATTATPAEASHQQPVRKPAGDHRYLDVSVVRIQEWLARTPDLKFRRGGSVLLTEATARDAWEGNLPPGTEWNDEAGDVDGVVSLVATDATTDPEAQTTDAAWHVARRIRERVPYCHIQAVTGTGTTYAEAYETMARKRQDGEFLVDSPPAPPELILAKPCDQCRSAAAVHPEIRVIAGEERKDLCAECHERFLAAGGTKGDNLRRSPLPERRMKKALQAEGMIVQGFSDNFAKMAAAGRVRDADASTQLALIYADGNRVGAFLHEALAQPGGKIDKRDIVHVIDDATVGALADAVMNRFSGWGRPPVLANLAGGDDLLVSVPAADAWLFTRTLLASFGRRLGEGSQGWPETVRMKRPSLSAGLVFHHKMHPFSDLVRLAGQELHTAKAAGQGEQAMVSFLDLTADGGQPPEHRTPVSLQYLDQHAGELERVEEIPPSRRQALLALLRRDAVDDVIRRVADMDGNQPLWDVIAGPGATVDMARKKLAEEEGKLSELWQLLDIARHRRTQPRQEDAA